MLFLPVVLGAVGLAAIVVAALRSIYFETVKIACATSHGHGADPQPHTVHCRCVCHRVTP